uniref:Uncharacterized protein n=1 Tax=Cryptococcus bacillisporus CA1280 TaxID=1296109 RepID=A0A0D0VDC0_CRYGA|nr:hypothetical protein I312_05215 [Cryptococcus bacillisporus CA1280]
MIPSLVLLLVVQCMMHRVYADTTILERIPGCCLYSAARLNGDRLGNTKSK